MICPGDTVRISSSEDYDSSTLGRVIDITDPSTTLQSNIRAHPENHLHGSCAALILIQLIMCKLQSKQIHPAAMWPFINDATKMATRGLDEVTHTNCVVWVHPNMILTFIGVFHTNQCRNQTFGAVAGRDHTFFTCSNALFDHVNSDCFAHEVVSVLADQYFIFGPATNSKNPSIITETEREVVTKHNLHRIFQKLLTKMGKIGGTIVNSGYLPRDDWSHLASFLSNVDPTLVSHPRAIQRRDTAQTIVNGNLSLETKFIATTIHLITVRTPSQFAALRSCLSQYIGVGIKKRPPNRTDREEGNHIKTVQIGDVINIANMDLTGYEDHANNANNAWFPEDAAQQQQYFNSERNFIRFRYDTRTTELRVTIKTMAIKVGNCDAEPFMDFLRDNGIPFGQDEENADDNDNEDDDEEDDDGLRLCRGVYFAPGMWVISHVDRRTTSVVLVRRDPELDETINITIDQAIAGLF